MPRPVVRSGVLPVAVLFLTFQACGYARLLDVHRLVQHGNHVVHGLAELQNQFTKLVHIHVLLIHTTLSFDPLSHPYIALILQTLHFLLQRTQLRIIRRFYRKPNHSSIIILLSSFFKTDETFFRSFEPFLRMSI